MTLYRPIFMQPALGDPDINYSGLELRGIIDAMFVDEGVFGASNSTRLRVSQRGAGANMSVDAAPGSCLVSGDDVTGQRMYLCSSDAVVNVTIPAAPASGTRTHRIIARVRDKLHNAGWSTYDWVIEVLADTGAGTPAEPPSAITLATVAVSAGQSNVTDANITDQRRFLKRTDNGEWLPYTPGTAGFGSGTFSVQQGYYYELAPKVILVRAQISMNAAGTGSNPVQVGLPFAPDRAILRQVLPAHIDASIGQAVTFAGGSGPLVDRIRVASGNITGADMAAGSILSIQGMFAAA